MARSEPKPGQTVWYNPNKPEHVIRNPAVSPRDRQKAVLKGSWNFIKEATYYALPLAVLTAILMAAFPGSAVILMYLGSSLVSTFYTYAAVMSVMLWLYARQCQAAINKANA